MPRRIHHAMRVLLLLALTLGLSWSPTAQAQSFRNPPATVEPSSWSPPVLPDHWETLPGVAFTIHGPIADDMLLRRLAEHGSAALPRLASDLGVPIGGDVHVFLAATAEDFRALQPGNPPTWADGTAYPSIGAIFLRHPKLRGGMARPLEQVLEHEMVHVLLGRAFHPVPTPRWLQEGVAQVYSGEAGPELPERLSRGLRHAGAFSLADLENGFPADAQRADLAYAQSADFIQWFRHQYGDEAIQQLVQHSRSGSSLAYAVKAITGEPLADIDARWKDRLVSFTPVWTSPEAVDLVLWGGAGMAILVVGFLRRRRWSKRLKAWRDDDRAISQLARQLLNARHQDT